MAQSPSEEDSEVEKDLEVPFDPFFVPMDAGEDGSDVSIDLSEDPSYDMEMEEYYETIEAIRNERARVQKALEDAENEVLVYDDPKKKKKEDDEESSETKKEHVAKSLFTRPEAPPPDDGEDGSHLVVLDESILRRTEKGQAGTDKSFGMEAAQSRGVRVSAQEETVEPEDIMEQKVGAPPRRPTADLAEPKLTKEVTKPSHKPSK